MMLCLYYRCDVYIKCYVLPNIMFCSVFYFMFKKLRFQVRCFMDKLKANLADSGWTEIGYFDSQSSDGYFIGQFSVTDISN